MSLKTSKPEMKQPKNCPILEIVSFNRTDMCTKEKLEDSDLDILGISHVSRSRQNPDYYGASEAWFN